MKRMQLLGPVLLAAGLAAPTSALAKPAYLSCDFLENGSVDHVEITADEDAGVVALYFPRTDYSVRFQAAFSSAQVAFSNLIGTQWVINRTNLSLTITKIGLRPEPGRCKLAAPPKRAF